MKKLIAVVLSVFTLMIFHPWALALSGDKAASKVCAFDNSNSSITAVSAASGFYYRIFGVFASADDADDVLFKIGSTTLLGLQLGANSGFSQVLYPLYLENGTNNESIVITKTAATDLYYCVWYEKVKI